MKTYTLTEVLTECGLRGSGRGTSLHRFEKWGATPKYEKVKGIARATYVFTEDDLNMIVEKERQRIAKIKNRPPAVKKPRKKQTGHDIKKNGPASVSENRAKGYYARISPMWMMNAHQKDLTCG